MSKPLVVLLHGITRSNFDMKVLENRIKRDGYDTLNIKYASTKHDIDELTDQVQKKLEQDDRYAQAPEVHFVAHSMGGLIARHLIYKYRPDNLGKLCQLGTPNQGSEMADFMSDHRILSKVFQLIFGPAGEELRTDQERIDEGIIDYPLGVIASDVSLNPIGKQVFDGPNDTLVSIESTKIDGMADHIIMKSWNSTHAIMMFNPDIMDQILIFLKNGAFDHKKKAELDAKISSLFRPENPPDFHP